MACRKVGGRALLAAVCVLYNPRARHHMLGQQQRNGLGMLQILKDFLNEVGIGDKPAARFDDNDYRLAAAALLIHVMTIDGKETGAEVSKLRDLLKRQFDLDDAATGRTDRSGERGRSRGGRPLRLHQPAQPFAR